MVEPIGDRSSAETPKPETPKPETPRQDGALVPADEAQPGALARGGMAMIRFYQRAISPLTPPACRFRPTCSQYMLLAIKRHGFVRGSWLGLKRLMKCHPFHPGGHDPVP